MKKTNLLAATLYLIADQAADEDGLRLYTYRATFTDADIPLLPPGKTEEAEVEVCAHQLGPDEEPAILELLRDAVIEDVLRQHIQTVH